MNDELEQLYDRALKLPAAERASFAADVRVSDEGLRAELMSLIEATEEAEQFFQRLGDAVSPPVLAEAVGEAVSRHSDSSDSRGGGVHEVLPEGEVVGRYSIIGQIGHGGMGTVYRARDIRLQRDVALKFLHPFATGDADAEVQLLGEARAAASLQHPNICVVHEIGETTDGKLFIAMALCEGETLKQRLARGAIDAAEAVAIASQIARALHAAHSRGIIHRDVKPGNIILADDGMAKLLDFGLAKSSETPVTGEESTPGTVSYMSPEQVRGEPVDQRTDLWSLGVVLYEMLAGHRPFRGRNGRTILQSILRDDPEPLKFGDVSDSSRLPGVVEKLLRKNREERYATASEVLGDLQVRLSASESAPRAATREGSRRTMVIVGAAAAVIGLAGIALWSNERGNTALPGVVAGMAEPSIAVLPLTNLGTDSLDAVLARGITEDLIATLSSAGGVKVIASTSTAGFRNRDMDVRLIAESLGVSNILEGGLQKTGSQVRVDVRLIAAHDGSTLWSQAYDREFKDVFAVRDDIVRTVAAELGLRFDKDRQLRRHGTRSIAAYELYLRGSDPILLRSQAGVWKALDYFQQAIAADSTYAAAYAGLALTQVRRARNTSDPGMTPRAIYALAEKSALKAIELDDALPEAHYALSRVREATLDFPSAMSELQRAIALDPTRSIYHRTMATLHGWAGDAKGELAEAQRALDSDPLNPYAHVAMAGALTAVGRFDEALVELERASTIRPPLQALAFVKAQVYLKQQRLAEAIATLRPQAEAGDPMFRGLLGNMLARAGQHDEAKRLLADLIAASERTGGRAFQVAMVYAGFGDFDETFKWLDKSVDDQSISSMIMGPTFDELHRDPRFEELRERLGLRKRS